MRQGRGARHNIVFRRFETRHDFSPCTSALKSLPLLARGKVRDNYAVGNDRILMVASDRISAFDVIMGEPIRVRAPC